MSCRFVFLPSSTACARAADGRATSGETDTTAADVSAAEHGRVAEHVGDDEEAHVGAPDVDLVEVGDAAVAGGDGDVLELDVHVVLGCAGNVSWKLSRMMGGWLGRTVEELATVGLARGDFKGNDVALYRDGLASHWILKKRLREKSVRTCASLRSLIGMPIVDVMVAVAGGGRRSSL